MPGWKGISQPCSMDEKFSPSHSGYNSVPPCFAQTQLGFLSGHWSSTWNFILSLILRLLADIKDTKQYYSLRHLQYPSFMAKHIISSCLSYLGCFWCFPVSHSTTHLKQQFVQAEHAPTAVNDY